MLCYVQVKFYSLTHRIARQSVGGLYRLGLSVSAHPHLTNFNRIARIGTDSVSCMQCMVSVLKRLG